ncbi:efflux RND transporter periplasmic adaptor subunit [Parendozoicomonas haliclonae]|uniref:HlyD family secretion protein n=1 Tax=Parendozoicomonas haliclonae TaxID=1960125 RepID=A0A1X7AFR6_9GAMM|nr:HlyD family efflux transporter periplasmic adaptor subunit [Parendozoicomonas haliclonae]SMA38282.1 HlyD family secretion protein [Parendozoicomonas haliclonae]
MRLATDVASRVSICETIQGYGQLKATRHVELFFEQSGKVSALGKDTRNQKLAVGARVLGPGTEFPLGQPLGQLDTKQLQLESERIRARLDSLEIQRQQLQISASLADREVSQKARELKRIEALAQQKSVAQSERDQATHALDITQLERQARGLEQEALKSRQRDLEAELALLELALEQSVLRAPFDGVIAEFNIREHGMVLEASIPGSTTAVVLVSDEQDTVNLTLLNRDVARLSVGLTASVCDRENRCLPAEISSISPRIRQQTQTRLVTLKLGGQPSELQPDLQKAWVDGQDMKVTIFQSCEEGVLAVPKSALVLTGKEAYLYRIQDGHAYRTVVVPGATDGSMVNILEGVQAGDVIVREPHGIDLDGVLVSDEVDADTDSGAVTEGGA